MITVLRASNNFTYLKDESLPGKRICFHLCKGPKITKKVSLSRCSGVLYDSDGITALMGGSTTRSESSVSRARPNHDAHLTSRRGEGRRESDRRRTSSAQYSSVRHRRFGRFDEPIDHGSGCWILEAQARCKAFPLSATRSESVQTQLHITTATQANGERGWVCLACISNAMSLSRSCRCGVDVYMSAA